MAERIFGKYEKIRRLAQGGMGDVFLGRQSSRVRGFDRLVILKSLRSDLAREEGFIEQFLDEARVAANLNHPNVVSIFEVGEWEGTFYIAMEYIAGEDLSRLWYAAAKKGLGLPFSVTVKIIQDACNGLDHAHHAVDVHGKPLHIVHRDISPQNIMVRGDGVTKVVDFGIAKASNRVSKTKVGTVKGKLQYMSPEQVKGEPLDGRSDLFSLGVVLWEMCTGKRLFKADSEIETLNKILTHPIPPPSSIVKNFPLELEEVILRMLERDRKKRYASCADAGRDLAAYLERAGKAKSMSVAEFVGEVLGDQLKQRTQDLTPDSPTTDGGEARPPTGERDAPSSAEDWKRLIVERERGGLHRFDSIDEILSMVRAGQLSADDRLQLGPKKSMALGEHPDLKQAFKEAPKLRPTMTETWIDPTSSDSNLSTDQGRSLGDERGADAMPSPNAPAPAAANLSLMAVPTPDVRPAPVPAPAAPPSPPARHLATPPAMALPAASALGASALATGGPPTNAGPAGPYPNGPYPNGSYQNGPYQLGPAGPAEAPAGPFPTTGPAPYLSGPMPQATGPWGPSSPAYQLPTSPPGYGPYPGYDRMGPGAPPEAWRTPITASHDAATSGSRPGKKGRSGLWVAVLLLLVVTGAPAALYFGDRPTFDRLKARVLGDAPGDGLSADALRAAVLSDDEGALKDALVVTEPSTRQSDDVARARAFAATALLHAGLAQIEIERARLYGLTAGGDAQAAARIHAAESAADDHRVAAYKGATQARSLAGQLRDAHVAMAAYQALRGAAQEMEADFEAALRAASPEELAWLQVESLGLRALLEARRALAATDEGEGEEKRHLEVALKDVRVAREAAARARPPIDDRRLAYAEAALLVELARAKAEDPKKARALLDGLTAARPTSERLRLLALRLGVASPPTPAVAGKPPSSPPDATPVAEKPPPPKELSYDDVKRAADNARRRGQTYKAASLYQKAIKLRGTAAAWTGLGWAYLDLEKNDKAIDAFERALRLEDEHAEAVFGQAEALRFSGERTAAVKAYKRYLQLAPGGDDAAVARNALKTMSD